MMLKISLSRTFWRAPPTISVAVEQHELDLFPDEPWGGVSPRGLTRGHLGFIFKPEAQKHARFFDPEQIELFPRRRSTRTRNIRRIPSAGAVTLLPLPKEVR